jgi:hypothetical protein
MKEQPFHSLPIKKNKNKKRKEELSNKQINLIRGKNMKKICLLLHKNNIKRLAFKHFCVNL